MSEYDVFISYSRKDSEFVRQLVDALSQQQRAVWIDWRAIDYSTKWWEEICYGIDRADNALVVISPDSLNSVYCHREIEHARKRGKRIICLIYRDIDEAALVGGWYTDETMHPIEMMARENWEHLKTIQFISYPKLGDLAPTIQTLLANIDTDPECKRAHTLLLQQAQSWIDAGRSPGYLLQDEALQTAETRMTDCREHVSFSAEQEAFVSASRRAEDEAARRAAEQEARTRALEAQTHRAAEENTRLGRTTRRYRITAVLLALVGVVAVALTVIAARQLASAV
ncbi:MAG: toll/interleukin-1 receptor domain-containing protein, partial [Anaerolineae bacterium]|nr:toll/interleukin-1 receptor domain-containing protein [Anaerolineae bacterium]